MNILRLSTLSLTLAIAVFSLGYVNPSAAKPFCPGSPSCKPPTDNPIAYTAELTGTSDGAFVFAPVIVTLETKAIDLQFETNPKVRPLGGNNKNTGDWFNVFNSCDALGPTNLPLTEIPDDFQVATFGGRGGGHRVGFIGIVYGPLARQVDVVVQLIGTCRDDVCRADFLPDDPVLDPNTPDEPASNTKSHLMVTALLQGHTLKGLKPRGHCNRDGHEVTLDPNSNLVITAILCPAGQSLQGPPPTCS